MERLREEGIFRIYKLISDVFESPGTCIELRTTFSLHARATKRVRKSDVSSISDRSSFRAWPRMHDDIQKSGPSSSIR